jgi:hypothetical protein
MIHEFISTSAPIEHDPFFPDEIREEGEKFLEDNKLEYELLVYKDVPHGKPSCFVNPIRV